MDWITTKFALPGSTPIEYVGQMRLPGDAPGSWRDVPKAVSEVAAEAELQVEEYLDVIREERRWHPEYEMPIEVRIIERTTVERMTRRLIMESSS